jgi:glycosyltransferase involved in cell wall biosynthesis
MIAIVNNHWMHYKDLLFRSLSEKKVDFVAVFSALGSSQRAAPALNEGYNYRVLYPGDYEKRSHAKTGYRAWRTLQQLKPSTVIIEGWRDLSSWTAWLWAILHKVPIIFWSESNDFDKPRNPMAEWPKRLFASRVSYGHVYGRSNRDYLTNLGIPKDKVLLDRVVVNTEMFLSRQSSFDSAALRFLYVGRLAPEKNLEYLLNEFSSFVKQARLAHTLTIVGSGPLAPKLEAQVKTLGLEKSACLTRSMPYERLGDTYAASHIFVLPSLSEPWGLVAAEAMCAGLPAIISSRCGCAADLVTEKTGWLFDPAGSGNLAEALSRVAATPIETIAAMGLRARHLAAKYSPANAADLVISSISLSHK